MKILSNPSQWRSVLGMEAVYVHGERKRWAFGSGLAVAEALDHVSRDTEVSADLLVLESKAGGTDIILGRDAKLVAGNEYRVRVRNEALPKRRFGVGLAVDPASNYYVSPNVDGLVSDLMEAKYCVLCGPRQSGKSTMVMAARRKLLLQSRANVVYLDGLEGAKKDWSSLDLWGYLCDSLTLKCPSFFPKQESPCTALVFKSLFVTSRLPSPVTLVLDEADTLLTLPPEVIDEFFATIRAIKNDRNAYDLHGFLLVGVETVKDLLEAQYSKRVEAATLSGRDYVPGSTPSRLSPFPHDHVLSSSGFTLEDVKNLLQQAAADRPKVDIDVARIATSLFQWTAGHKGLTGTCLAYLVQEELWTFKRWILRAESYRLGTFLFGQATYSRILDFIRKQERFGQASELLLKFLETPGVYCGPERLVQLRDYIANGVLAAVMAPGIDEDESEADTYYVCISSPLLRTAMLRRCVVSCDEVDPPPSATHLDREWLILQAVKTLDGDVMCRSECLRAGGAGPAEYAHQFLFLCRLKAILRHAYPSIRATVLPEVKEEIVPGEKRSQLRCDSLVRDGPEFAKFAAELVANGTLAQIVEHMKRAMTYHEQHSAQVFVINFCMDRPSEHIVTPSHDSLIFVSVNFRPILKEATVTFVDSSATRDVHVVPLKNWNGCITFEDV